MKGNIIRWCIAIVMLAVMACLLSAPGLAEEFPALSQPGAPLMKSGWITENEYKDDTIHAVLNSKMRKQKSSHESMNSNWIRIKISDPTQLRTTLSNNSYEDQSLARSKNMIKGLNAVVALNDDFAKYQYNSGHVTRQGVVYRDALDGSRDILIVDSKGDFSYVLDATPETMSDKVAQLEADGRTLMQTFSFGPVLIADGEVVEVDHSVGKFNRVESHFACQRIVICQLGELEYAVVEIDGGDGSGANIPEIAAYVKQLFPECKVAYNLDGGGSTNLFFGDRQIHRSTRNHRPISGLIYFVSGMAEE